MKTAWPEPTVTNPDIPNPTCVPYLDCLLHRMLDAQQDINLAANEGMDQSLANASTLIDEIESCIRKSAAMVAEAADELDTFIVAHALEHKRKLAVVAALEEIRDMPTMNPLAVYEIARAAISKAEG